MKQTKYAKKASYSSYYSAEEARKRKIVNCIFIFIALCSIALLIFMYMKYTGVQNDYDVALQRSVENKALAESLYSKKKTDEQRLTDMQSELDRLRLEYDSLAEG